jgi:hypothetical protein
MEKNNKLNSPVSEGGTIITLKSLNWLGLTLLVVGFAGPWTYGPLGKSSDWGWLPVWGILFSLISANLFILFGFASCVSYLELIYRLGRPPLEGILKWLGGFLLLIVVVPLVVWLPFDQTNRSPTPQVGDGSLGWGTWVALAGLIINVVALRLQIQQVKKQG